MHVGVGGEPELCGVALDPVPEFIRKADGSRPGGNVFCHGVGRYTALCTDVNSGKIFARFLTGMRGYGLMIARAREAAGFDVPQLAERIGQSDTTVRRLEAEETEPSVKQINALVAALPISAEALLKAMGVNLSLPLAAKLPRRLVELLAESPPENHQALIVLIEGIAKAGASR